MNDSVLVRRLECFRQLAGAVERGAKREWSVQRLPFHQFEHQEIDFPAFLKAIDRGDIGMIQRCERAASRRKRASRSGSRAN